MRKVKLILISCLFLLAILFVFANRVVNDYAIPAAALAEADDRVLAVFAHPDDEIMLAGTFAGLDANNITTGLVYLTQGEAGPTGGLVAQADLGRARVAETRVVQNILGVDYLKMLNFPDSAVAEIPGDEIMQALRAAIADFRPTIIIGFDDTIGLYGHEDHRLAGLYLRKLLEQSKPEDVRAHYMVTLPEPMIKLALKMSRMFRERYASDPDKGLPAPDIAVTIWPQSMVKKRVLQAHKTQWQVIGDVQPYAMAMPASIYYGIFSREYFHRVLPPPAIKEN